MKKPDFDSYVFAKMVKADFKRRARTWAKIQQICIVLLGILVAAMIVFFGYRVGVLWFG